jgi:hypothetical protein
VTLAVHDGHRVQVAVDVGDLHVHQVHMNDLVRVLRWSERAVMRSLLGLSKCRRLRSQCGSATASASTNL